MLLCADGTYYTGVTNHLERRFAEHATGEDPSAYTASRRPLQLFYAEEFQWIQEAIEWEKRLKKWSASKKKALIRSDWEAIKFLAKCKNASSHEYYRG